MSIEAELTALFEKHGEVTPTLVVEAAKVEGSALHDKFDWDDSSAAREYRLQQARRLIRVYRVTYDGEPQRMVHVPRIAVEDDPAREGQYLPISLVVRTQSRYQRALDEALKKLASAERAVSELRDAAAKDGLDESVHLALAMQSMQIASEALRKIH